MEHETSRLSLKPDNNFWAMLLRAFNTIKESQTKIAYKYWDFKNTLNTNENLTAEEDNFGYFEIAYIIKLTQSIPLKCSFMAWINATKDEIKTVLEHT